MIDPTRRPVALVAARLHCTEGQVFTMVIGLGIALVLAVAGIPAVLRTRSDAVPAPVAAALSPFAGDSTRTAPTTPPAPTAVTPRSSSPGPAIAATTLGLPTTGATSPPGPSNDATRPAETASRVGAAAGPDAPGTVGVFTPVGDPGAPGGLAVGPDGTVFVTTDNGTARGRRGPSRVFAFRPDGTLTGQRAVAGQAVERVGGLTGVAVRPGGGVSVLDPEGRRIVDVDMGSRTQTVLAPVPDLPPCVTAVFARPCQPGFVDRAPFPVAAAYDHAGNLLFTDPAQDTIWRFRRGARTPEVWYQSADFSSGEGPFGLAVDDGSVRFTVGATNDLAALGAGALYRLTTDADGTAGDRMLVHAFARDDAPGPVALGRSGRTYVALGGGAIITIAPDGSQDGRIDPPGGGPIPLDAPSAVALVPGALLVANGRTSDDPARWAVLTIAVDDGPVVRRDDQPQKEP